MTARERRRVVKEIEAAYGISERRAIRFTGFPRSSMRYRSLREPQEELRSRIWELAHERPRWGYRRIHLAASARGVDGKSKARRAPLPCRRACCEEEGQTAQELGTPAGERAARASKRALEHGFRKRHARKWSDLPVPDHSR